MTELVALCWRRYLQRLDEHPIKTKAITAGILAAVADIIAQRLSNRSRLNWRRTVTVAMYGVFWGGPSNHFWQMFLENFIPRRRGDVLRPGKKVLLDQLTYGPLNNVMFMIWVATVVEGRSASATLRKVRADYPSVQLKAWRLWPAAALINQSFVPLELRVLFNNAVALLWTTFLISKARTADVAQRQVQRQLSLAKQY